MNTYIDDTHLPEISDETLTAYVGTARAYTLLILKRGPAFPEEGLQPGSAARDIVWRHGKRNVALRTAGIMPIVCPVVDGSDLCGIGVFDASPEDVHRIMGGDPGVRAGLFVYEVHPTRAAPGSTLPAAP
jgi:hypothetical protein